MYLNFIYLGPPGKVHHNEEDNVLLTREDDRIPQQATMIRKVAYAPSAPTYTGLFVTFVCFVCFYLYLYFYLFYIHSLITAQIIL